MIVGSKTFALEVEDPIEHKLCDALFCLLYSISKKFNQEDIVFESGKFDRVWSEGYAQEFRDLALEFFDDLGFDVQSNGKDF